MKINDIDDIQILRELQYTYNGYEDIGEILKDLFTDISNSANDRDIKEAILFLIAVVNEKCLKD